MPITRSQNRETSMARDKKHSNKLTLKEAGLEKIRTLHNQRGNQTRSIQTRTFRWIDHIWCFQWRPINTLQKGRVYKSTQGPSTTIWHYQWGRRIWSRRNQRILQKRKRHSISSALERIWKWTRPMDNRNKSGTCKRGNSRLLDTAFETKPIKERTKGYFFNISNAYQHSRNTSKHVLFHKCCYQCLYHCCLPHLEPGNLQQDYTL